MRFYIYDTNSNLVFKSLINYKSFGKAERAGRKLLKLCQLAGHIDWVDIQVR